MQFKVEASMASAFFYFHESIMQMVHLLFLISGAMFFILMDVIY